MYSQNPYLPHSLRAPGGQPHREHPEAPPARSGGLPVGTAVHVLDWVGEDPQRAMTALNREHREDRPRVTLVSQLATIIRRGGLEVPKPPMRETGTTTIDIAEVRAKLGLEV